MSWLDRPEAKRPNPATKFLSWSSNDKCFKYYDKEKEQNVMVSLPMKFVILEHYHTVKGWNDASESGIYSNEVLFTGTEEMEVKSFKGGLIAKGFYKEIKHKVHEAGGHYCRSVYVVLETGELANLSLKGSAVSEYSDFTKNAEHLWQKNWMSVTEFKEMKKGSIKYTVPVFGIADEIKDASKIIPFAEELQDYMKEYFSPSKNSEVDKYEMNSNLQPTPPPEEDAKLAAAGGVDEEEMDDLPFN